ncbi:MAG TPA: hypothetical protein VJN18_34015 [Polyangiaceae bacterium]|nr:hypothetical protein [Polyangiaceae bacterium]
MPEGEAFRSARGAILGELAKDYDVATFVISSATTAKEFGARVSQLSPSCLVLMDNSSVSLLRSLQRQGDRALPPAVVLMAAFLREIKGNLANLAGVVYEVPGITAFLQLRAIVAKPVNRVGVIHRPTFANFVERERALAQKEQFTLVPIQVPRDPSVDDIHQALDDLRGLNVDAIWVLNDSGLIRDTAFFQAAWLESAPQLGVPIIVNVSSLIDPSLQFGTIGILPDHEALGTQAANLVLDLADADWKLDESAIELPTSTITIVDMSQVNSRFELAKDAQRRIDKALE